MTNANREKYSTQELKYCADCTHDYCSDCVVSLLNQSEYGRLLQEMPPRFAYFAWDDADRFKAYLGNDVDPFKHGEYQAEHVAIPFIEHQNSSPWHQPFSRAEAKMLVIGNVLHDAHEGICGDVALPEKDDDVYEAELRTNLEVVSELMGLQHNSDFMKSYRAIVGDLKGWSHAGRAFNAIERCGYFLTGVKAWSLRNHSELDYEEQMKCREMGHAVITNNVPVLAEYSREFAYPAELLRIHEVAINEVI
jgi:hypothetical protein